MELDDAYARLLDASGESSIRGLGTIRALDFQRFAHAVGDLNPRYFPANGQPAQAPPIFLSAVMGWGAGPPEEELRADGTDVSATAGLPLDGLRLMGAGQELTLHRPVRDQDRVTMTVSVESVTKKVGSSGPLLVVRLRREYRAGEDDPLATCIETFIAQ